MLKGRGVQISWQAQDFVDLEVQISWQVQDFADVEVQSWWQAQDLWALECRFRGRRRTFCGP